jgi:hypothetical protein
MNKIQIDKLIQLLQKYELSIAVLYETFASILTSSKNTWMAFSKEERIHAKWIGALHTQLKKENISFEQTKFTAQSTKLAIDYVEKQAEQAIQNRPDLMQSLNIAINIEKSLLESAFLSVFKLTGPKTQKIQTRLKEATKSHINKLIEWRTDIMKT